MIRVYKEYGEDWQEHIFENEEEFIRETIRMAEEDAVEGHGEVDAEMESWGFKNVVDAEEYNEDGEVIGGYSHYEGDYEACVTYWNKYADRTRWLVEKK
ncbi:MAG: hypothetical protein DBY32_04040 [Phascolarctobacterium sp.]|nr:MAG: hypothetical protein DBY32_04040 [Phascolarctobacterium sp.]